MAFESDTLNLGSLHLKKDVTFADAQKVQARPPEPANHPDAAEAARVRIAAAPEAGHPLAGSQGVPAAPTADLVTDKMVLAHQAKSEPLVGSSKIPSALRPILTAVGIFALVLLLFKSPIILSQLSYTFGSKPAPAPNAAPAASEIVPAENTITVSKINVHAPVIYEPSIKEGDIQKALENGVVHYGNTAAPGQPGNVAIFGHSSNDWWEPGNFKFVFVLLDKLAPGDRISLDYNAQRYTYEVVSSRIVEPTEVSVLNPTSEPTLSLITCTPPGTSLRRLVVTAKQVDPSPNQTAAATPTPSQNNASNLPSSAPGFFTQIKDAWNGIVHGFKSLFGGDTGTQPSASPAASDGQIPAVK